MFDADLFSYLSEDAGVLDSVSDRLFPLRLDEGCDLPAIAYQLISAPRTYTHDNADRSGTVKVKARYQFACWAQSALEAIQTAEQLVVALSGYQGDMGSTYVQASFIPNEYDTARDPDTNLYRRIVDAILIHEEDLGPTGS